MELSLITYQPPLLIDDDLETRRKEALTNEKCTRRDIFIDQGETLITDVTPAEITSQRVKVASFYEYNRRSTIVSLIPHRGKPIWALQEDYTIQPSETAHWLPLGPRGLSTVPIIEMHNRKEVIVGEVLYPDNPTRCPTASRRARRVIHRNDRKRKM